MSPRLRALLVGGLSATIAGTAVVLWTPHITATRADLVDAGITADFVPRRLACWALWDGGYREFAPVVAVAKTPNADGGRDSIWPRSAIPLRAALGDENANCQVVGSPTWAEVADFYADPPEQAGSCACNPGDGGCFGSDGGPAPRWLTLHPGEYSGPNCRAKVCGELNGRGSSWPAACGPETP